MSKNRKAVSEYTESDKFFVFLVAIATLPTLYFGFGFAKEQKVPQLIAIFFVVMLVLCKVLASLIALYLEANEPVNSWNLQEDKAEVKFSKKVRSSKSSNSRDEAITATAVNSPSSSAVNTAVASSINDENSVSSFEEMLGDISDSPLNRNEVLPF